MKYIFVIFLLVSCNAIQLVTGVDPKVDPAFDRGEDGRIDLEDGLVAFWAFEETSALSQKTSQIFSRVLAVSAMSSENPSIITSIRNRGLDCSSATAFNSNGALKSTFSPSLGQQFTIAFWVQFNSFAPSEVSTLAVFDDGGNQRPLSFENSLGNSSQPNFFDAPYLSSPLPIDITSNWTHFAFKYDLTTQEVQLYQNGSLKSSVNFNTLISVFSSNFFSLCSPYTPASNLEYFRGQIDSFGMWDRALNDSEIENLWSQYTDLD